MGEGAWVLNIAPDPYPLRGKGVGAGAGSYIYIHRLGLTRSFYDLSPIHQNSDFERDFASDFESDCEAVSNWSSDFKGFRN